MFAVLKTGGKQYKVQSGDMLRVEKLAADAGEKVQFNDILTSKSKNRIFKHCDKNSFNGREICIA